MSLSAEADLIARCCRGDSEAWNELFALHYDAAGRFIFQLGHDLTRQDVEEICQDVFITVIQKLSGFHGTSQFRTWLFRIAANRTRDYRIRRFAQKRGGGQVLLSLQSQNAESGLPMDPPDTGPTPDNELLNIERMALLRQALDQLGDPCREIIELRYFGELSYEQIAVELKMNPKTVSSRLSKCLDRLQQLAHCFVREKPADFSV